MSGGLYGTCRSKFGNQEMLLSYPPSSLEQLVHPTFSWGVEHVGSFFGCVQALRVVESIHLVYLFPNNHKKMPPGTLVDEYNIEEVPKPPPGANLCILVLENSHFGVISVNVAAKVITIHDWMGQGRSGWGTPGFQYLQRSGLCQGPNELCDQIPIGPDAWSVFYDTMNSEIDCRQQVCGPLACLHLSYLALGMEYENGDNVRVLAVQRLLFLLQAARGKFTVSEEVLKATNCVSFRDDEWKPDEKRQCLLCSDEVAGNDLIVILDCKNGCHICVLCMEQYFEKGHHAKGCPLCAGAIVAFSLFSLRNGDMRTWHPEGLNDFIHAVGRAASDIRISPILNQEL